MKRTLILAILACVPFPPAVASEPPPPPPIPPPSLPILPDEALAEPLPPAALLPRRPVTPPRPKKEPVPPTIRLGDKHETDKPDWQGAGFIDTTKIAVKADGGKLKLQIRGGAYSHSLWGVASHSLSVVQSVQEFDVDSGNPRDPRVKLSMAATIVGYVRTEKDAMAALRVADAVVYPAAGGQSFGLAFPPFGRGGGTGKSSELYEQESETAPVILPAGHYVLVANFVLESSVESCLRGHAESVFSPESQYGTWHSTRENLPPESKKTEEELGFTVTVKAVAPGRK